MLKFATEIESQDHFRILGTNFSHYSQVFSSKLSQVFRPRNRKSF